MSTTTRRLGVAFAVVAAVVGSALLAVTATAGADPRQITLLEPAGEGAESWSTWLRPTTAPARTSVTSSWSTSRSSTPSPATPSGRR
jgi:hypothetical protein